MEIIIHLTNESLFKSITFCIWKDSIYLSWILNKKDQDSNLRNDIGLFVSFHILITNISSEK